MFDRIIISHTRVVRVKQILDRQTSYVGSSIVNVK